MSRGPKIAHTDITPRHLRPSGEVPGSVTVQVGSTVADARRQLVLRTFASTGGDQERSAKLLGISPGELRKELGALLDGAGPAAGRPAQPARETRAAGGKASSPKAPSPTAGSGKAAPVKAKSRKR